LNKVRQHRVAARQSAPGALAGIEDKALPNSPG